MKTHNITVDKPVWSYNLTNGSSSKSGAYWVSIQYASVPMTVKRVKPIDLWANQTSRYVRFFSASCNEFIIYQYGYRITGPGSYWLGFVAYPISAPSYNAALARLQTNIKDQKAALLVLLAERREAYSLLRSLIQDTLRVFHSLRSGRALKKFVRILKAPRTKNEKAVANQWLRYQFGIIPTMMDIEGLYQLMADRVETGRHIKVTVRDRQPIQTSFESSTTCWTATGSRTAKLTARFLVRNPSVVKLKEAGLYNVLSAGWELIPYSFVVDWFFQIGPLLDRLDFDLGISDLKVYFSWTCAARTEAVYNGKFTTLPRSIVDEVITSRVGFISATIPRWSGLSGMTGTNMVSAWALTRQHF